MKIDEPFNPNIKSSSVPMNISFELAVEMHKESICSLMAQRNPLINIEDLKSKTEKEISLNRNDPDYRLFVAVIKNEVVGFCRFYHSRSLPKTKIKFASPEGWYAMGTMVSKLHKRKSIAKFLFRGRLEVLKNFKAQALYSIVDVKNETSIRMHREFGFVKKGRADGFLHLDFQGSEAILFKFVINNTEHEL